MPTKPRTELSGRSRANIHLKRALAIEKEDPENISGAIEEYKKAIAIDPDNPLVHFLLGRRYYDCHDFDLSEEHLKAALQLSPSDPKIHWQLGMTRSLRARGDKAQGRIETARTEATAALGHLLDAIKLKPSRTDKKNIETDRDHVIEDLVTWGTQSAAKRETAPDSNSPSNKRSAIEHDVLDLRTVLGFSDVVPERHNYMQDLLFTVPGDKNAQQQPEGKEQEVPKEHVTRSARHAGKETTRKTPITPKRAGKKGLVVYLEVVEWEEFTAIAAARGEGSTDRLASLVRADNAKNKHLVPVGKQKQKEPKQYRTRRMELEERVIALEKRASVKPTPH